jgi:hypothetical protein
MSMACLTPAERLLRRSRCSSSRILTHCDLCPAFHAAARHASLQYASALQCGQGTSASPSPHAAQHPDIRAVAAAAAAPQ